MFYDILIVAAIATIIITAIMLLVRMLLKKTAAKANADMMVWFLYQEKWSGQPNEILYAWRTVLYDLKKNQAPLEQIEAAERSLKYYERITTKSNSMVGRNGKMTSQTIMGGA